MLKILYINATAELGGTDTDLLATVRALDKTLFAPTVLLPHPGPLDEQYRATGVPVIYRDTGIIKRSQPLLRQLWILMSLPLVIFRLWWFIRREEFDLVYSNSLLILSGGLAARLAGKKAIWHSGEMYTRPRWLKIALYSLVGLLAHRVIVSSEAVRQLFPERVREKVITVHNGIDLTRFNPCNTAMHQAAKNIRLEFGIPENALLVGFVGRFIPWKGVKEYVQACALARQHPDLKEAHFIAVGSCLPGYEGYFEEIAALARQAELAGRFHLATNRQDIPAFLAAFDLFVHASTRPEPFGIVIIEALAMGKPVIATVGGGVPEILDDPCIGRLVERGNMEAMAQAITELATNPTQRHQMSLAARKAAQERFDITRATRQQEEIYLEVVQSSRFKVQSTESKASSNAGVQSSRFKVQSVNLPRLPKSSIPLTVVIVNYNGREQVIQSLAALRDGLAGIEAEVFLVDNASTDTSLQSIQSWLEKLPQVERMRYRLIENQRNLGYTKANNQAIRQSRGDFILLLNPDARIEPDAIHRMLDFMRHNSRVGIAGPKILLSNGKLDAPCHRSFKTPGIYLYKFLGLSKLFPRSRRFGQYYLSWLDENESSEVDAVIGAFMLVRREVIAEIGLLDERYFMYCEDEDWCFQAKKRGWEVWYYPAAVVHHQKGASTSQRKLRMVWEWHKSVFKFHRKNLAANYPLPVNLLIYGGIMLQLGLSLALNSWRQLVKKTVSARRPEVITHSQPDFHHRGRRGCTEDTEIVIDFN